MLYTENIIRFHYIILYIYKSVVSVHHFIFNYILVSPVWYLFNLEYYVVYMVNKRIGCVCTSFPIQDG